ncbi:hypothetical protein DFH09DRAFT_1303270 [Mycena vulgaris]|nr:hypothetical protein DFH09DRAFT_1303270 [Mycena vulgaris]
MILSSTIPIELQERILDCLDGDLSTLKSCSFVCGAWRPTTKIHLFRKLQVSYDASGDDPSFSYCAKFVAEVLHLAQYIREVEIEDGCGVLVDGTLFREAFMSEPVALCAILDRTHSLHRISISTFCGSLGRIRPWRSLLANVRGCISSALHRSLASLSHLFLDGFSLAVSDLELFRGMQGLEYVGLERMGVEYDNDADPVTPIFGDSQPGGLHTLALYFIFSDPANGALLTAVIDALAGVNVSHITNLRLGGVINASVFQALPLPWLSNLTHLALELTNLNPTHPASPLSAPFLAKVSTFRALRILELSLNVYPSDVPQDLSGLEIFLSQLLPPHRLSCITTTVAAHGPPVYLDAVRRHYDFCRTRADIVKVRWEDGKLEYLQVAFPEHFADGTMEVGKFRRQKWISW